VTVRLSEPDACWQYIPATPGGQVASKAYLESHPDDYGSPDGLSLGTGPYKVESWKTGSEIVLVKNEYYWGEEPQFDEVVVSVISDESAMAMAMDSGQIDFCILQSNDLASSYEDSDACDIYAVDGPGNTLLSFNCGAGPCADENLRKAIASCVDIQGMISAQYGDYASLGTAIPFGEILYILDPQGWKDAVSKMSAYEFDLEKAKEYLEKSSYNGEPVEFNIIENNNAYANMAQLIQANCAMIGINIEIIKLTMSEYYANAYGTDLDADGNRKYDMMINRWTPDYLDPAGDLVPFFGSDNIQGGANYAAYSNPEVDALLKRQAISADNKERSDLMIEACQIATEECPYKALCFPKTIYARSNRVAYDLPGFYLYTINFRDFTLGKR
jgi:peptide/nickel transport system substrate-binding protein